MLNFWPFSIRATPLESGLVEHVETNLSDEPLASPVLRLMNEIKHVEESCFSQAQLVIYSTDSFLSQLEECLGLERSDQEEELPGISFWGVDLIMKEGLPGNAGFIVTLKNFEGLRGGAVTAASGSLRF